MQLGLSICAGKRKILTGYFRSHKAHCIPYFILRDAVRYPDMSMLVNIGIAHEITIMEYCFLVLCIVPLLLLLDMYEYIDYWVLPFPLSTVFVPIYSHIVCVWSLRLHPTGKENGIRVVNQEPYQVFYCILSYSLSCSTRHSPYTGVVLFLEKN